MTRLTRAPYVLTHAADVMGCGHHRIMRPMEIMARSGYIAGRCDARFMTAEQLQALAPDVVVWQRQLEDMQIEQMQKARVALPNAFFVYEIDDIMSDLPDWSPHKPFISPDVDARMARAVAICDAVTVTTHPLREHMQKICGVNTDVRVIPNMLGRDELARVDERRASNPPSTEKLRIGWGGGFSHSGDLALIVPAMREFANRVEFVFLGQKPDCEVPCEFHPGVPPTDFLPFLAGLRLNMIVAPLTDCTFNRCKSNLRLLEAAAIGCPVIASPVHPYVVNSPPVVYAQNAQEWVDRIGEFVANPTRFARHGERMRTWLDRNYIMDNRLDERVQAWLPKGVSAFKPHRGVTGKGVVLVSKGAASPKNGKYKVYEDLKDALVTDADVIYVRPGTTLTDGQIERLVTQLRKAGDCASVVPMSNDGGAGGFPMHAQFVPVDPGQFTGLDMLCEKLFRSVAGEVTNPAGPVQLISRRALAHIGDPDPTYEDTEAALIEWGVMALARGYMNIVAPDVYVVTQMPHALSDAKTLMERCHARYPLRQMAPDPMAQVRFELDLAYHREFYDVPRASSNASYTEWAALFTEVGLRDHEYLKEHWPQNVNVVRKTYPFSRDDLLELPADSWVMLSAESTLTPEHAAYVFAAEIERSAGSDALVYYADHDHVVAGNLFERHDFKPHRVDWHLLLQRDYVTPVFCVAASELCDGGWSHTVGSTVTGVDLYRLVLDIVTHVGELAVRHIPRVLAHLTTPAGLPGAVDVPAKCGVAAAATGLDIKPNTHIPLYGQISYVNGVGDPAPKVSIIMPTGGRVEMIAPCVSSLLATTKYENYELIIIKNMESDPAADDYLAQVTDEHADKVSLYVYPGGYNWSAINNWAIKHFASGELLLLLNDDTRFHEPDWLAEMVGAAAQPHVGAVGARLIYPHDMVQHVGVVCRNGLSGHLHKGLPANAPGYNGIAMLSHQATAVTGACLLIRKHLFEHIGCLDERLAHNFNDVALCLELDKRGFRNVLAAKAVLQHVEGATRLSATSPEGMKLLLAEGTMLTEQYDNADPYWNENLFFAHSEGGAYVTGLNCDQLQWPPAPWGWRTNLQRERVLLVGDDGVAWVNQVREGNTPYFAMLNGFSMQIARPTIAAVEPFDIRESVLPREIVSRLGIDRIVLRSILGGTAEVLPFLLKLGVPVEYLPHTAEAVCPRTDFKTLQADGSFDLCDAGWRKGTCRQCVEACGSPFGAVSLVGWRDQWRRFFEQVSAVTVPLKDVADVVTEVYGPLGDNGSFSRAAE